MPKCPDCERDLRPMGTPVDEEDECHQYALCENPHCDVVSVIIKRRPSV